MFFSFYVSLSLNVSTEDMDMYYVNIEETIISVF